MGSTSLPVGEDSLVPQVPAIRDLVDIMDDAAWSRFQKAVLACLALVFAVDGLANQSLGIAVPALITDWGVERNAFAPVTAANLAGIAVGSVLGGMIGDRIGRRTALIAAIVLFGCMTVAGALTNDPTQLMIVRCIDGLGIGAAIPNGAALISEFTPRRRRGRAIAIGMVFIPIGGILAGALGASLLEALGWRSVFVIAGAVPLLTAIFFLRFLPESPSYLLKAGRRKEFERVMARCRIALPRQAEVVADSRDKQAAPLRVLFTPGLRRSTFLLWGGFFTCLMASYTIFSWVPTMLQALGFTLTMTSLGIMAFHAGGVVGALSSGIVLDSKGFSFTHMLLSGVAAAIAALLAVLLHADVVAIAVILPLMMALGFCIAGLHNTLYTLAATVYPTAARATGVGLASATGRLGAVLSSFTGVISLDLGGSLGFFGIVAILLALCGISGWAARGTASSAAGK